MRVDFYNKFILLLFFAMFIFSFSVFGKEKLNALNEDEGKGKNDSIWEMQDYGMSIAKGPTALTRRADAPLIVTPYIYTELDGRVQFILEFEGMVLKCPPNLGFESYTDVIVVRGENVRFNIFCPDGLGSYAVPSTLAGTNKIVHLLEQYSELTFSFFYSGVSWTISSKGFRKVFETVKEWGGVIQNAI
ncbi:TPA: hypothetical protein ACGUU3_004229 [Vibrio vulnificus]